MGVNDSVLNEDVLLRALRHAELPDAPVHYHGVVESTNAAAMALAREGAPEWTIVAAAHQVAGRGRLGRTWVSEPGSSLLFSFVLRPRMAPERASLLTLLAGAAMAQACQDIGRDVRCKWPNDLLLDERKVGGILAEAVFGAGGLEFIVVGVGVNVGAAPAGVEGAAGLGGVDQGDLLGAFLAEFSADYRYRPRREFASAVLGTYRPLCVTLGRRVRAQLASGHAVEGTAEDLDERGALLVRIGQGVKAVGFGEVVHLRS